MYTGTPGTQPQNIWQNARSFIRRLQQKITLNWIICIVSALLLPFIYQAFVEFIRCSSGWQLLEYLWLRRVNLLPGYLILACVSIIVLFLSARPWVVNLMLGVPCLIFGYANFYKLLYRNAPVVPRDLAQLGEAVQINGTLETPFRREIWLFLAFLIIATLLLLPFRLPLARGKKPLVARLCITTVCSVPLLWASYSFAASYDLMRDRTGYGLNDPLNYDYERYYYFGTAISSFFHFLPEYLQRIPSAPAGYSQPALENIAGEAALADTTGQQPDVILVLLESFFDIEQIEGTTYAEELMPNYRRLAEEGIAGSMYSPSFGGGTALVEFSVITGYPCAELPAESVPYIDYIYKDYPSLPLYFSSTGYHTLAIHPYFATYYNRQQAFDAMHFDKFVSLETINTYAGDGSNNFYDDSSMATHLIAEYEALTQQDDRPIFIHGLTMQNHAPYDDTAYDADYRVQASSGLGQPYDTYLSALATGIRDADAFIGIITDYFSTVDRDVVLLFYGDHQANIGDSENPNLMEMTDAYQNASPDEQWVMTHKTPYLMWANNYTVQSGAHGGVLAPYMLVPTLFQAYDVAGPPLFAWLAAQQSTLAGVTAGRYFTGDGTILPALSAEQEALYNKLVLLQYDLMFGKRYSQSALYYVK